VHAAVQPGLEEQLLDALLEAPDAKHGPVEVEQALVGEPVALDSG
jgi:hypothetical protein